MIIFFKRVLMWIFRDLIETEKEKHLAEAKEILEKAKTVNIKEYVNYEVMSTEGEPFLYGIQPLFKNRYLVSMLCMYKSGIYELAQQAMAANDKEKALISLAQMNTVDGILRAIDLYEERYNKMLEIKEAVRAA